MANKVTLEELLEAGAHFGHQAKRWNPKMAPYLYGVKDGVHIFDLAKTREMLEAALEVISKTSQEGKNILIVGTKKQIKQKVQDLAGETGIMYVNQRWLGGTLTNFNQILNTIRQMSDLKLKLSDGYFKNYTKKERLLLERKSQKMQKFFGGIEAITKYPDLMIVIDTHKESGAVAEAVSVNIPIVGVVDSNADPDEIDYPIPMNDDASKALEFVLELIKNAIMESKKPQPSRKASAGKAKKA